MEAVHSYPFGRDPGLMPDATEPTPSGTASQVNKRRRIGDPTLGDNVQGITEGYDRWNEDPQQPQASKSFTSASDPPPFTSRSEHDNPSVESTEPNSKIDSQWAPHGSSYPELAGYQQQPYFYQQTPNSGTYTSSWQAGEPRPYEGTGTSSGYPVEEQTSAAAMPYFPPRSSAQPTPATETVDDTAAMSYSDLEHASQYAYSKPSALVTAAQREAAKQSSAFYFDDAGMPLKIQSLPILDNLATQIIHTISKASYHQIQDLMRGADSEDSQSYRTLKNLFDQTRKVYSRETPFIDAIDIQMFQPNQQEIIRKANIATFISSILGAHDVSFFHLNEFFMETFVPLGHRLLKWQGAIYLELKTQSYISAVINSDGNPEEMLDELFPHDLDAQILTRHPDAPSLSPSETDFIDRSRARKSYLLAETTSPDMLQELPKKYQWTDFVREFASCITKNVDGIMNVPARSAALNGGAAPKTAGSNAQDNSLFGSARASQNGTAATFQNGKPGRDGSSSSKPPAAASTIRQPWTKPEEDALLAGLDRVSGPHWSQILALYGRGGSVSEVLKDRNQVQLKDKARNLKLWYLKTGKQVPSALQGVTGELRKRGGARARAALVVVDDDQAAGGEEVGEDGLEPSLAGAKADRGSRKKGKK